MENAIRSGGDFDPKGPLDQKMKRLLKHDPEWLELQATLKDPAVPNKQTLQSHFRMMWSKKEFAQIQEERNRFQQEALKVFSNRVYEPADRIVELEGVVQPPERGGC